MFLTGYLALICPDNIEISVRNSLVQKGYFTWVVMLFVKRYYSVIIELSYNQHLHEGK